MSRSSGLAPLYLIDRIASSMVGGYLFVWGFTTLGITLGVWLGMPYLEAQTLLYLLAFLVYASVFCWGFTVQRTAVVWTVLAGGGVAMTLLGWCLGRFYLT